MLTQLIWGNRLARFNEPGEDYIFASSFDKRSSNVNRQKWLFYLGVIAVCFVHSYQFSSPFKYFIFQLLKETRSRLTPVASTTQPFCFGRNENEKKGRCEPLNAKLLKSPPSAYRPPHMGTPSGWPCITPMYLFATLDTTASSLPFDYQIITIQVRRDFCHKLVDNEN